MDFTNNILGGVIINNISLDGKWNYKLDPLDKGILEKWFDKEISTEYLNLPGTLCENNIGKELDINLELNPDNLRSLKAKYDYIGACWYQKKINIPKDWDNKKVFLYLERIIIKSEVWINDKYIGNTSGLVTAHVYEISEFIIAGEEYTLTILIDNRDTFYLSTYGHSYTNESQTIWNGIVGEISLYTEEKVYIDEVIVITATDNKSIVVKGVVKNNSSNKNIVIDFDIKDRDSSTKIASSAFNLDIGEKDTEFEYKINIDKEVTNWDEFTPKLYQLSYGIKNISNNFKVINFGFRNVKAIDRDIFLNNKKIYLRGNLECCVHPLTGYPPCDEDYWINIFKTVKEYGMNHIRYHSNCPPEAAFNAADKVGVYLQVEGPVWLDNWFMELGSHKEHYEFMPLEAIRIIKAYSNHPSFCIFCNGNEFRGDFSILHNIIESARKIRPDIIYTLTANYDRELDSEDDIFIAVEADKKGMRGNRFFEKMATTINTDYSEAVKSRNIPLVAHEGGQYAVYPNIKEIPKYNGNLVPLNFMAIKEDLINKNMLSMVDKFVKASGDFSARLYKEEIESYMRTIDYAGFQILGIQDFPGQCTATIGILDSFWESKNLVSSKWFRQFCNDIVVLIKSEKRIYHSNESFSAEIMVNQFSNKDINVDIIYNLVDKSNKIIGKGFFENNFIKQGTQSIIGNINIDLSSIIEPTQLEFTVEIKNSDYKNSWDIWVYPSIEAKTIEDKIKAFGIEVFYEWNKDLEQKLNEGKRVLFLPKQESFINRPTYEGSFYPVFWSPVFFKKKKPCGAYINKNHDIFKDFVTSEFSNYQWYNLFENSYNFDVDNLPKEFTPIIETIPNYYYNHRMTNLIEAKVGNGILIVCSMKLDELSDFIEVNWFKNSLVEYLNRVNQKDLMEIDLKVAKEIFISDIILEEAEVKGSSENFIN